MVHCPATERKEVRVFTTPRMSLESVTLRERSQTQKATSSVTLFIRQVQSRPIHVAGKQTGGGQGLGRGGRPHGEKAGLGPGPHSTGAVCGRRKRPRTHRGLASASHTPLRDTALHPETTSLRVKAPPPGEAVTPTRLSPPADHPSVPSSHVSRQGALSSLLVEHPPPILPPPGRHGRSQGGSLARQGPGARPDGGTAKREPWGHGHGGQLSGIEDRAGTCGH